MAGKKADKNTGKITVTLCNERIEALKELALRKGVPMPTLCRVLLTEIADGEHKIAV